MNQRTAVIVGAGVGGPVLALWLRRAGVEVRLIESRSGPALAEGAFLGVAPNGLQALSGLGLDREVAERGHRCLAFEFLNHQGRVLGGFDRSGDEAQFGWALTMIRRGELHGLLADAAVRAGVRVEYGKRLSRLTASEGAVELVCDDGETVRTDFVVGCDGLRSTTRALGLPDAPPPAFSGLLDVGGFARVDGLPFARGVNTMVFGAQAFFGAFTTADGETWWFHNGAGVVGSVPAEQLRPRLLELHRDDPPWVQALISQTPTLLGPWGLYELDAMPTWSRGRVCLMGDAAHAMSPSAGQGASMAFEDALVLAQCLRDVSDVPTAFQQFERLRRPRVDAIMKAARQQSNRKAPGPIGRWVRDRVLSLVLPFAGKGQSRAYAHRLDFEHRVG